MRAIEIAKDIYWIGALDWNIRDFHGYATYQGSTYNAYLIIDEKIALIDAVKSGFGEGFLRAIRQVVDPKKIDYVISNHTEMDHSGALPLVMAQVGENKPLFCSEMGRRNLSRHFRQAFNYRPVKTGEALTLGKRTLSFLETRMLHWPDSMVTYSNEDRILFSSDAFGQHYAGPERFDDEIDEKVIMPHAQKYFANILLLYAPLILKLLEKIAEMGLAIDMICPDHGIMWRRDPGKIIQAYRNWSLQEAKRKALVIYDTMWHSTEMMAEAIMDALMEEGVDARMRHLRSHHRSDIITEVMDAGVIAIGSPTLNNGLFPTVSDFLCYMKGLKPKNKTGAAFGSYGWSGEAVKLINQELEEMKFKVIDPGVRIEYVPYEDGLSSCYQLGKNLAAALPKA